MNLRIESIRAAIQEAGLAGAPVCLHASLSSFGPVEGGAGAVVEAFSQAGCTLLVPAFTYRSHVPTPAEHFLIGNGEDRVTTPAGASPVAFDPRDSFVTPEMGVIPAALPLRPDHVRSTHPLCSFAAIGPRAQALLAMQTDQNVYAPYQALYDATEGFLLLAGVGLTRATPIHFAEQLSGRTLFQRWTLDARRGLVRCAVGSCSEGFERLAPALADIEQKRQVGASDWRIFPFRAFVDACRDVIRGEPAITHCNDPACLRCRDATAGGPRVI